MATVWQLKVGATQSNIDKFSIASPMLSYVNQGPDEFTFQRPLEELTAEPSYSYGQEVALFRSGSCVFRGKIYDITETGDPGQKARTYICRNAWFDMQEMIAMKQVLGASIPTVGGTTVAPALGWTGHFLLNFNPSGGTYTIGQQITALLQMAISYGVNIQVGDILSNAWEAISPPLREARNMSLAEIIYQQLRWVPSATVRFDYRTNPPTINITTLPGQDEVSFSTDALGSLPRIVNVSAKPRYDLQRDTVWLRWERTETYNGKPYNTWLDEIAPAGAAKTPNPYALIETLDQRGAQVTDQEGVVVVGRLAPDEIDWWKNRAKSLRDDNIIDSSIEFDELWSENPAGGEYLKEVVVQVAETSDEEETFTDWATAAASYVGWSELLDGQASPWMGLETVKVTFKTYLTYQTVDSKWMKEAGKLVKSYVYRSKEFTHSCTLVNVATALDTEEKLYTARNVVGGDPYVSGLAQYLLDQVSVLQWDGSLTLYEADASIAIRPGQKLNVSGSKVREALSTMNAQVQQVSVDLFNGYTSVSFGPAKHLGANDLVSLIL